MTHSLNDTHDPALRSWVDSANTGVTDFPIQNLPLGVFRPAGSGQTHTGGIAIGDQILPLSALAERLPPGLARDAAQWGSAPQLNALMAAGPAAWSALRAAASQFLRQGAPAHPELLLPQAQAEYAVPAHIGDYTDFYTSIHHATAVGKLFRPDNPLLPNYTWVPIGYHGRASTVGVSGQTIHRPAGQIRGPQDAAPVLAPSRRLDYELEVGLYVGAGNPSGAPIPMAQAEDHLFGLCLLNDWSARDLQAWEYQPLGPFLSKNFATTVSPWIVTMEALAPYRTAWTRPEDHPAPLPYLDDPTWRVRGGLDITLEVRLQTAAMRQVGSPPTPLARTNFRHAYWAVAQLIAHHTVNGCVLQPGDLLGSGTQSGPTPEEAGSLLELTQGGRQPLTLPNGEQRVFLEDGDTVEMAAWAEQPGRPRVGLGSVQGLILPAR